MDKTYESLRDDALTKLKQHMDSIDEGKAKKLAYWIRDYTRFLNMEPTFNPIRNVRYKRGSVIKAHLGFRIGSEEGGLHYAIVLDNDNKMTDPTVTVVPLTSIKKSTDLSNLHPSKLSLGNELFLMISQKEVSELDELNNKLEETNIRSEMLDDEDISARTELNRKINQIDEQIKRCEDIMDEISKMKNGSIALIGQITTISKIRIYNPKHHNDPLYGLRFSDETLDMIDNAVKKMYTKKEK